MKQLFVNSGKPKVAQVSDPEPRVGSAIVQTMYSFVSTGTERSTIENQARPLFQRFLKDFQKNSNKVIKSIANEGIVRTIEKIMSVDSKHLAVGYSLSGRVLWACPSTGFLPGDLVACAGSQFAYHAQLVLCPKNLMVKISDQKYLPQASASAVCAIAINAFFKSGCGLGQVVLIIGLGTLGSILAQVASSAGCLVFAIENNEKKRDLAKDFGVSRVFASSDQGALESITYQTGMSGVDAVFITTGVATESVLQTSMSFVRPQGKVVVVSDGEINFGREDFYKKEVSLIAACSYGPGRYNYDYEFNGVEFPVEFVRWSENRIISLASKMIQSGKIDVEKIIQRELQFDDQNFQEDYNQAVNSDATGIVIKYDPEDAVVKKHKFKPSKKAQRYLEKPFKTTAVGVGQFFQSTLMHILKNLESCKIFAVVDQDAKTALSVGQLLITDHSLSSLDELLELQVPEVAIVSTDHASHGSISLKLLAAGVHTFLEKPVATKLEELLEIEKFLNFNRDVLFAVDFNRTYSPFFATALKALEGRSTPCVVNYRVNALFLSKDHWVYRSGGRIIGEACHFIEFLIALVGSRVLNVKVSCLKGIDKLNEDNFYATFEFVDGSIANLCYTSLGNASLEKEKIEVFWEGRSLVIEDFKTMVGFGTPIAINSSGPVDKGHEEILSSFFHQIESLDFTKNRVFYKRAIFASKLSFIIDSLVREGGGIHQCAQ